MKRRRFLHVVTAGTAVIAGCVRGGSTEQETMSVEDTPSTTEPTPTERTSDASMTELRSDENTTTSTSIYRKTATTKGTAVYEANPADLSIENTTTEQQTVGITGTRLPEDVTPRPSDEAPHQIQDLPEQPTAFSTTTDLSGGAGRAYRCTGMGNSSDQYQISVNVQNGPMGAFDWRQTTGTLYVAIKNSSIEFAT